MVAKSIATNAPKFSTCCGNGQLMEVFEQVEQLSNYIIVALGLYIRQPGVLRLDDNSFLLRSWRRHRLVKPHRAWCTASTTAAHSIALVNNLGSHPIGTDTFKQWLQHVSVDCRVLPISNGSCCNHTSDFATAVVCSAVATLIAVCSRCADSSVGLLATLQCVANTLCSMCMLNHCLEWYNWVLTNLNHDRQWFNTLIPPSHESPVTCFVYCSFSEWGDLQA